MSYRLGARVELHGLSTTGLNGLTAVVIAPEGGRVGVELEGGRQISVRPANLRTARVIERWQREFMMSAHGSLFLGTRSGGLPGLVMLHADAKKDSLACTVAAIQALPTLNAPLAQQLCALLGEVSGDTISDEALAAWTDREDVVDDGGGVAAGGGKGGGAASEPGAAAKGEATTAGAATAVPTACCCRARFFAFFDSGGATSVSVASGDDTPTPGRA